MQQILNYTSPSPSLPDNTSSVTLDKSNKVCEEWKIVLCVILPLIALVLTLVGVYAWYRRKYPVRMIIGRDFAKFSNPHYARPSDSPALVREDAREYFSKANSLNVLPEECSSAKTETIYYNLGFEDNEDEQELSFVERKTSQEIETDGRKTTQSEDDKAAKERPGTHRSERKASAGNHFSSITGYLKSAQKENRKNKKNKPFNVQVVSSDSSYGSQDERYTNPVTSLPQSNKDETMDTCETYIVPCKVEQTDKNSRINEGDHDYRQSSSYLKTSMMLFQQPTFEEVWATVKARSRSLSVDRPLPEIKPRSFSMEPSKSARKVLFYDTPLGGSATPSASSQRSTTTMSDKLPEVSGSNINSSIHGSQQSSPTSAQTDERSQELLAKSMNEDYFYSNLENLNTVLNDISGSQEQEEKVNDQKFNTGTFVINQTFQDQNGSKIEQITSDICHKPHTNKGDILLDTDSRVSQFTQPSRRGSNISARNRHSSSDDNDDSHSEQTKLPTPPSNSLTIRSYEEEQTKALNLQVPFDSEEVLMNNNKARDVKCAEENNEVTNMIGGEGVMFPDMNVMVSTPLNTEPDHVYCIHNNPNIDSDDEDTGLKLTDSDISEILGSSSSSDEDSDEMNDDDKGCGTTSEC